MNTQQAMKAKSEWLVQCLSFGWEKDDLDSLSAVWDKFKDEYGNLKQSKPQSEPLPDSGRLTKEEILYKHSSNSMTRYPNQIRTEVLAAMEEYKNQELAAASTVSEAGEDAIGFVEWIDKEEWLRMLPENTWVKGMEKADDVDAENYYTTEQLYQLYKQSKQ